MVWAEFNFHGPKYLVLRAAHYLEDLITLDEAASLT